MNAVLTPPLTPPLTEELLRALFTKPYGAPGPSADQWRAVYDESVHFQDPTQWLLNSPSMPYHILVNNQCKK
jgi:hypothetical protein